MPKPECGAPVAAPVATGAPVAAPVATAGRGWTGGVVLAEAFGPASAGIFFAADFAAGDFLAAVPFVVFAVAFLGAAFFAGAFFGVVFFGVAGGIAPALSSRWSSESAT